MAVGCAAGVLPGYGSGDRAAPPRAPLARSGLRRSQCNTATSLVSLSISLYLLVETSAGSSRCFLSAVVALEPRSFSARLVVGHALLRSTSLGRRRRGRNEVQSIWRQVGAHCFSSTRRGLMIPPIEHRLRTAATGSIKAAARGLEILGRIHLYKRRRLHTRRRVRIPSEKTQTGKEASPCGDFNSCEVRLVGSRRTVVSLQHRSHHAAHGGVVHFAVAGGGPERPVCSRAPPRSQPLIMQPINTSCWDDETYQREATLSPGWDCNRNQSQTSKRCFF